MSSKEELMLANADIMNVISQAKKIGWDSVGTNTLQRVLYLMKVLYAFCNKDDKEFAYYHFNVTLFGPYSDLVYRSLAFLLSSQRLLGDLDGEVRLNSDDGINLIGEEKKKWIAVILLILGKYGENKIFSFIVNDPLYAHSVKANINSEINIDLENSTLMVLNDFKKAFEETLQDTSSISSEEYISLYFDYVFGQIIEKK